MTSLERVQADMREALRAGDKERLSTLRLLVSELRNEEIRGAALDDSGFVRVVQRAIKQRREAADGFRAGGREEAAAKELREAETLAAYLPRQADEGEIRLAVEAMVREQGLQGAAATGTVMKAMMARFAGRADGTTVSRIVRDVLARPASPG
jgi:uncharacterized protein YqeY